MPKKSNNGWEILDRVANFAQLFGVAWIGSTLSQTVPIISAFGWFGMVVSGIGAMLILFACAWLQSKAKKKSRRTTSDEDGKVSRFVQWKGWQWVLFLAYIAVGLSFLELRPRLPSSFNPTFITLPIASYRDMRKSKIVGKAVLISEVPRNGKQRMTIQGKEFENCQILGPAVILAQGETHFSQPKLFAPGDRIENVLLETKGKFAVGMIEVRDCNFSMCQFMGISFIAKRDSLGRLRYERGGERK